jgi:chromosome segregation ATPase
MSTSSPSLFTSNSFNPISPSKLPDLSDIHHFSKASTQSSEEPLSSTPQILQLISGINEELRQSVQKHQRIHEIDKQANSSMLMELKKVRNDYLKEKEDWKSREKALITGQEVLEQEISSLKYELIKAKTQNSALQAENSRLLTLLSINHKNFDTNQEDLKSCSNHLNYSASELESLRKNSSNSTSDSTDILRYKDQVINSLKSELTEAKILNKSILLNRQMSKNNELENILAQKLKLMKIPGNFIRDPEQSYIFNGKKISLMIKSGQLLCKTGSIFRPFEDFVRGLGYSSKNSLTASHKRFKSLDFHSDCDPRTPKPSTKAKF